MQMLDSRNFKVSSKGFTLVEVLVLLLIVSIIFGLTVARLPISRGADATTELRRFERLFVRLLRHCCSSSPLVLPCAR